MTIKCPLILAVAMLSTLSAPAQRKAVAVEGSASMLTYGFSDPDPVANPDSQQYPYFRFDGYDLSGKEKEWKTVTLENEWIRVTLFPEIGGKIWGALDKISGKEFVYTNDVVKFRDIAMRGAWTSGGIEFNFGLIGHVPTTATPVDYTVRENKDGSVSCLVASFELMTETWWMVEVNVPSDRACFITKVNYINTSALDQPYYNWMNAAFKAGDDLQLCIPGDKYIGHGGDSHPYPVDQAGRDLSIYSQNAFEGAKSYHILGKHDNYFGAFWTEEGYGFAHCARPDEKLGRKVFFWSQSREGAIWEDLLTDKAGQYVEMQAGRMFNQPAQWESIGTPFKHHYFAPYGSDSWSEYWFPVENIGPFDAAGSAGAVSIERETGGRAVIRLSPIKSGTTPIAVTCSGKEIFRQEVSLSPLRVWEHSLSGLSEGYLRVTVGDNEIVYDEDPSSGMTDRPDTMPEDFDWISAYGHCLKGEQFLNIRFYHEAEEEFMASLAIDKWFAPALCGMASLCLHCGRYDDAFEYSRKALSINTYDGKANYLYGLATKRVGKSTLAKDALAIATYTASCREAAYTELARIALSEADWSLALEYAGKCEGEVGTAVRMAALRHAGYKEALGLLLDEKSGRLPLFPVFNFERGLFLGDKGYFPGTLACELPEETILEVALWYIGCGLFVEADEACSTSDFPLAAYLRAWLADKRGDGAAADAFLEKAVGSSPGFVFPFRPEMLEALDWASERKPSWKTDYYRALIHWRNAGKDRAKELMESCGDSPDYAPFYLCRAKLLQGDSALKDLKKAESLSVDWRVGKALVNHYMRYSQWDLAVRAGEKYFRIFPDKFELGLDYAEALCEAGEYSKSLKVLSRLDVMPKEGAYKGHEIYRNACLGKAMRELKEGKFSACIKSVEASRIWDERLGVGKPYDELIDYSLEDKIIKAARERNRNAIFN